MTDRDDENPGKGKKEDQKASAKARFLSPTQRRLLEGGLDSIRKNGAAYDLLKNR